MLDKITTPYHSSFRDFIWKNKHYRLLLLLTGIAMVVQFAIFKYLFPYPSFIHDDSVEYINIAYYNTSINTYMVGYSRFLRLFSVITDSDTILVAFQYLLVQCSALYFLFTIFYFYRPAKIVQFLLLSFSVLNPLFLNMANLISSDVFFLGLSMIWFTLLLWIINQPNDKVLVWHAIILFFAFTVRYNALLYPFISIIALWLSPISIKKKIGSFSYGIFLCALFVCYTGFKYQKLSGHWQYAPFSGWQLANNALYAYRYVDSADRKPVTQKYKALDRIARIYFDSTRDISKYPHEGIMAGTYYMWRRPSPLNVYRDLKFAKDTTASDLKMWATMAPLYKGYGIYLIREYPFQFARYFLWPNAIKYYASPVEYLSVYNSGRDSMAIIEQAWFKYKSRRVTTRVKDTYMYSLDFFPIFSGTINMLMLCTLSGFLILTGWRDNHHFGKLVLLGGAIWLINAGFTIFASSPALRFQSFPIFLTTLYTSLLINWMIELMINTKKDSRIKIKTDSHLKESFS